MKRNQIITLTILFIAVSLFIWIGACSDDNSKTESKPTMQIHITPPATDPSGSGDIVNTPPPQTDVPTEPPATPTSNVKPAVDFTQLSGVSNAGLNLSVSYDSNDFSSSATKTALEQTTYILSKPGTDSKDIYMGFMLHYSDSNAHVTKLLDLAKEKGAKFTFYLSSNYLNDAQNETIIKRMFNEGHTIGSRGDKSIDQMTVSAETLYNSLWNMEEKFASIVGKENRMHFYSPDSVSLRNVKLANMIGYTVTFKLCNFVTDSGSRPQTYNGVVFQSSNINENLISQVTSYVNWGISEGYTFKGFTK